ncbi:CDP-glucose 4,6-dehydratase [Thermolongibacillus altinsuensis]|uniref:CDP-glucose 4,6-dehydratase n=2 Tax=Thermolongibacillus altinsuensis TaxID=575256 RepID=A0A4R1QBX0_9BACL|nr:CDP-glucose 4,6-dehydratase [Thermolongibacillus altinsuensis]
MINMYYDFWKGKKVFITGHTGFKGTWLSLWLTKLGAHVTGYALPPDEENSLFYLCKTDQMVDSYFGDVRDYEKLQTCLLQAKPDIVIHLAAQPLVRESYRNPVDTYSINVMGTVHLLDSVRKCDCVRAVVNVTTDKCYENHEWLWSYRENDALGGKDPYSNSKACSEFVTNAYRNSFFSPKQYAKHGVALASARAGNVIGGGDWAKERLIPDCFRAILNKETLVIRNPKAIRPWQHVLEPLSGYLILAEYLYEYGPDYGEAWNFGPKEDNRTVEWIVQYISKIWKNEIDYKVIEDEKQFREATYLRLDWAKAKNRLNWQPKWQIERALDMTMKWLEAYIRDEDIATICFKQIEEYMNN